VVVIIVEASKILLYAGILLSTLLSRQLKLFFYSSGSTLDYEDNKLNSIVWVLVFVRTKSRVVSGWICVSGIPFGIIFRIQYHQLLLNLLQFWCIDQRIGHRIVLIDPIVTVEPMNFPYNTSCFSHNPLLKLEILVVLEPIRLLEEEPVTQ